MSPIQTVAVAVRLFAIWLAIYAARWGPYLYASARRADDVGVAVVTVCAVAITVLAVLLLWFFPRTVARTLLPAGDLATLSGAQADAWLTVGCSLLGLWVLSEAIPALVRHLYVLFQDARGNVVPDNWGAGTAYILAELAVALWLLLGASGLRRLLSWARNRSTDEP
jgi:hypothetical protein